MVQLIANDCIFCRKERFEQTAQAAGLEVVGASFFKDHHRFSSEDMRISEEEAIQARADVILTTEKDMSRMRDLEVRLPLWAVRIDIKIITGSEILDRYLKEILEI